MSGTKKDAERSFLDAASNAGWEATKNGWPSYFLLRGDDVAVVEVLPERRTKLRKSREVVLERLAAKGIPCYVWSPNTGFTSVGGKGEGVVDFRTPETATADTNGYEGLGEGDGVFAADPSQSETTRQINEVWAHYVVVMSPRSDIAGEDERKIIGKALKVASVIECKTAISACEASDYHMKRAEYAGRDGNKYNRISQILKGRQGKETTRERIDWWLDRAEGVTVVEGTVPTADAATIAARKDEVRRGWRLRGVPDAIAKAEKAEAWLRDHGIQTERDEKGYPVWPRRA